MAGSNGTIRAALFLERDKIPVSGETVDISTSGALIRSIRSVPVGARGQLELDGDPELRFPVTVLRVDPETYRPMYGIGVQFGPLTPEARGFLSEHSSWRISQVDGQSVVRMQTGFTEATNFASLLSSIPGDVVFDLSGVRQISSMGVKKWVYFLERLGNQRRVTFAKCSPPFVQQASMIGNFLGQGKVRSVLVPYSCPDCGAERESEVELGDGGSADLEDILPCEGCGGEMELDVIPEAYLSFLG